jgi:hypothetical protein
MVKNWHTIVSDCFFVAWSCWRLEELKWHQSTLIGYSSFNDGLEFAPTTPTPAWRWHVLGTKTRSGHAKKCCYPKFWDRDCTRTQKQLCVHINSCATDEIRCARQELRRYRMRARNQEDTACMPKSRRRSLGIFPNDHGALKEWVGNLVKTATTPNRLCGLHAGGRSVWN